MAAPGFQFNNGAGVDCLFQGKCSTVDSSTEPTLATRLNKPFIKLLHVVVTLIDMRQLRKLLRLEYSWLAYYGEGEKDSIEFLRRCKDLKPGDFIHASSTSFFHTRLGLMRMQLDYKYKGRPEMTNITTPRLGQWVNNMALVPRPHNSGTTFLGSGIHTATVPVAGPGFRGAEHSGVGFSPK